MLSKCFKQTFSVFTILSACTVCPAALVSTNDASFGPNSFTRDTATGLEWLDVNFTDGMSFQNVSAQLGAGGTFAGLRHATAAELNQLTLNAGINPAVLPLLNYTPVRNFEALVGGPTGVQSLGGGGINIGSLTVTYGMTADVTGAATRNYGGVNWTSGILGSGPSGAGIPNFGSQSVSTGNNDLGHWLVRRVPEPSAALLVAFGASSALIHVRRRRLHFNTQESLFCSSEKS